MLLFRRLNNNVYINDWIEYTTLNNKNIDTKYSLDRDFNKTVNFD